MRKFQFRLQSLLEVKRRREEQAHQDFVHQEELLAEHYRFRDGLLREITEQRDRLSFSEQSELHLEDVLQDRYRLDYLEQVVVEKEREIGECRQELEQRRQILIECSRERKMVEKIRQKEFALWQKESARLEQVALDEVSAIAFSRRRLESGQIRTWILFAIMMALVVFLVYVTGTPAGRSWIENVSQTMMGFRMPGMRQPEPMPGLEGVADETPDDSSLAESPLQAEPSVASIQRERERLSRWEETLRQRERQVEMELVSLAELRDDIARLRTEVDQKVQRLEKLESRKDDQESQERNARLDRLAKLYTSTRPRDAARLLMELDLETTAEIIHRMREQDVVKIIQELNRINEQIGGTTGPERARDLLDLYAEKALEKRGS